MKPGPKRKPVKVRATRIAQALAGVSATELRRETAAQLDLLPLPAIASPTPLDDLPEGARGPGRPRGSRNKRTEETIAFILSRYRNPLVVLAETYSRPTAELATLLNCKKFEAFAIQVEAAKQLAPYVASKMPQALEIDDRRAVALTLIVAPDMAPRGTPTIDQMPQVARVIESKEKQELSDEPKPRVGQKGVGR